MVFYQKCVTIRIRSIKIISLSIDFAPDVINIEKDK